MLYTDLFLKNQKVISISFNPNSIPCLCFELIGKKVFYFYHFELKL